MNSSSGLFDIKIIINNYFSAIKNKNLIKNREELKSNFFSDIKRCNCTNYKEKIQIEEFIQKELTNYCYDSIKQDRLDLYYEFIPNILKVYDDLQESLKFKSNVDPYYSNYLNKGHVSKYNFNECLLLVDDLRMFVEDQYSDYLYNNIKLEPDFKPIYIYRENLLKQVLDEHTKSQLLYMDHFIDKYPGDPLAGLYKEQIIKTRERMRNLLEEGEKFYYKPNNNSDIEKRILDINNIGKINRIFNDPVLNKLVNISYRENTEDPIILTEIEQIELAHQIIYYSNHDLKENKLPWQQPTIIKNKYK